MGQAPGGPPVLAVAVWFIIEPRIIWPGFLLTFGLGAAVLQIPAGRFGGRVDAVVVLGGAVRGGRTVSPLLAKRVDHGLEVADRQRAAGCETPVLRSGGQGPDELVSEAPAMAEYAEAQGASQELVLLEGRSTTAEENLACPAALLAEKRISGPVAVVPTTTTRSVPPR